MNVGRVWDVAQEAGLAGLGLSWAIIQGLLLWSFVGILLGVAVYLGVARLGWLDAPGRQRRRWARVVFGLVTFLVFAPAAGGVGLVWQLRQKVRVLLLEQLDKQGLSQSIGSLLLLPTMLAHQLVDGLGPRRATASRPTSAAALAPTTAPAKVDKKSAGKRVRSLLGRLASRLGGDEPRKVERSGPDVTFLLKVETRGLIGTLAGGAARRALRASPFYRRLREQSALSGLLADLGVDFASRQADQKIAVYTKLMAGLRAGEDGKLFYSEAARHVGRRFFETTFIPYVEAPFDAIRLKLLLVALFAPLLVLGGIRLGLRRGAGGGGGGGGRGRGEASSPLTR